MKILFALIFISYSGALEASNDNEKIEFDGILDRSTRAWGLESEHEDEWRLWSGINTVEGIDFAIDQLVFSDDVPRRKLAQFFIDETTVSKAEIRNVLYAKLNLYSEANKMEEFKRSLNLLSRFRDEEFEVIRYLAGLFDDDRSLETRPRHPESYLGEPHRVSDLAAGLVRAMIEEKKIWTKSDPSYFREPNDAMSWVGRDRLKDALNTFLLREGIIETTKHPSHRRWSPPKPEVAAATPKRSDRIPRDFEPEAGGDQASKVRPWVWISAIIVLLLSIFQLIRSRRASP